jgi:hypothetical protein
VQQVRLRGRISAIRDVACEPPLKYHLLSQLALCTNAALGVEGALARQHATAFSVLGAASSPAKLKEKAAVGGAPKIPHCNTRSESVGRAL